MRSLLVLVAVVAMCRAAFADPAADAGKALHAFVDAAVAKKVGPEVVAFIAPDHDREHAVASLDGLAAIVPRPQLKILATNMAPSGTAAWLVAQISGARYVRGSDKPTTAPLRASAFVSLDGGTWHVRAAHISGGSPNSAPAQMCGNIDPGYEPPPQIAKGAEPAVAVVTAAFSVPFVDGVRTAPHVLPALSDAPTAQMFGSAPTESFTGGAAVKKVFTSWKVDLSADEGEHTRAGIAPGGDLAWVAMEVETFGQCTSYRGLYVLEKTGGTWKIVHQHYSDWVMPPPPP